MVIFDSPTITLQELDINNCKQTMRIVSSGFDNIKPANNLKIKEYEYLTMHLLTNKNPNDEIKLISNTSKKIIGTSISDNGRFGRYAEFLLTGQKSNKDKCADTTTGDIKTVSFDIYKNIFLSPLTIGTFSKDYLEYSKIEDSPLWEKMQIHLIPFDKFNNEYLKYHHISHEFWESFLVDINNDWKKGIKYIKEVGYNNYVSDSSIARVFGKYLRFHRENDSGKATIRLRLEKDLMYSLTELIKSSYTDKTISLKKIPKKKASLSSMNIHNDFLF